MNKIEKETTQTCEDIVGFPPQTNLTLHASHSVFAVALKFYWARISPSLGK